MFMKFHILKDYVTFLPGINPTKLKMQFGELDLEYYDQASFDDDYLHMEAFHESKESHNTNSNTLKAGDILISNSTYQAAIVGKSNAGKVPTLNFSRVEFNSDALDKHYFIYLFNCSPEVLRQKERESQGNGPIRRISTKSLGEFTIPIIEMSEQEKIGKIYLETLRLQAKLREESSLIEQLTNQIIEETLREKRA